MDIPPNLASIIIAVGLGFDIIGVILLFFTTSIGKIESELALGLVEDFSTEEGRPDDDRRTFSGLDTLRRKVKLNRRRQIVALSFLVFGFAMQFLGVAFPLVSGLGQSATC